MPDVQMPDGTIIQGVPDGMSQSELLSRYQGYNERSSAPAAQPDLGFSGNLATSLAKTGTDILQRFAEHEENTPQQGSTTAGLFSKALTALRPDLAPELSNLTSEDVRQSAGNVGAKLSNIMDKQEGVVANAGQFTGNVIPYLAVPGGPIVGGTLAGAISGYLDSNQAATASQGSAQALTNALYGGAEGAAGGAALRVLAPVAKLAGKGLMTAGKGVVSALNPGAALNDYVENRVGQTLLNNATNAKSVTDAAIPEGTPSIPGQNYTIGELSNDPGLLLLQRRLGATPEGAQAAAERSIAGRDAISNEVAKLAPQDTDAATRAALQVRQDQGLNLASNIAAKGETNYKNAIAPIASGTSPEDASTVLHSELQNIITDATNKKNGIYNSIDPTRNAAVDVSDLQATLKDITTPKGPLDLTPSKLPSDVINTLQTHLASETPSPTTMTVGGRTFGVSPAIQAQMDAALGGAKGGSKLTIADLQDLRPTISASISKAKANYEGDTVAALTKLKNSIDTTIQGFGKTGEQSAAALRAQEANTHFNTEFAPTFREGAVGAFEKANRTGSTAPTATMDRFFKSGSGARESIADLVKATKDNPNATQAINDFAVGKALKETGNNPEKLKGWIDKYGEAINGVPGLSDKFNTLSDATFSLQRYQARADMLKKGITSPRQSVIADYLNAPTAQNSMSKILNSNTPGQDAAKLINSLQGNKVAIQGAQRALVDNFTDSAGNIAKTPKALGEFYNKNLPVFQQIYRGQPEQLQRIQDIVKSLDITSRESTTALALKGSDTSLKQKSFAQNMVSKLASKFSGEVVGGAMGSVVGGHLGAAGGAVAGKQMQDIINKVTEEKFNKLITEALYDPEVAKTLAAKVNSGNMNVLARRLNGHLGDITPILSKALATSGTARTIGNNLQ